MRSSRIPLALAAALALLAAACDTHGDLRDQVEVAGPGTGWRVRFAGVHLGSGRDDAVARLGDNLGFPGDGGYLGAPRTADFGTTLDPAFNVTDGRVDQIVLTYRGNPLALRRVAARWSEVLARAGADCGRGSCFWPDGDGTTMIATLGTEWRWYGPREVMVTIGR
jgi:hypothetical protein